MSATPGKKAARTPRSAKTKPPPSDSSDVTVEQYIRNEIQKEVQAVEAHMETLIAAINEEFDQKAKALREESARKKAALAVPS